MKKIVLGEIIGTFILVFFGTGSVAIAVLFDALNLYQISIIWCCAVVLGIFSSKKLSDSHLNPAVSLGFWINKNITSKMFVYYLLGEFIGAVIAAIFIYLLFSSSLLAFESANNIVRGTELSKTTAMMFGEYYPNPGNANLKELSTFVAMLLEGGGTFVLMLVILLLSQSTSFNQKYVPYLIGFTVAVLIVFIAPYTQGGFNPFRDLGPRLVSALFGWKGCAFDLPQGGFLTVYCLSPLVGASLAALVFKLIRKNRLL